MKKHEPIQISIPHPCSQSWDEMTPTGSGRFCDHCQKTVIDFTTWSDAALYNYFADNKGRVCGSFLPTQLDRTIFIPYQPNSRLYRLTIALGLTLLITNVSSLHAQNRSPYSVQTTTNKSGQKPGTGFGMMKGRVLDEHNQPKCNAIVQAIKEGTVVRDTTTDNNGNYSIELPDMGTYGIRVISPGCVTTTTYMAIASGINEVQPVVMKKQETELFRGEIKTMPMMGQVLDVASSGNNVYQAKRSVELHFDTVKQQQQKK